MYESPKTYPGYATYSNSKIFAIRFEDDTDWTNQVFGYLDLTTNEFYSIKYGESIHYFDTFSNKMVVLDNDHELFLYEFE